MVGNRFFRILLLRKKRGATSAVAKPAGRQGFGGREEVIVIMDPMNPQGPGQNPNPNPNPAPSNPGAPGGGTPSTPTPPAPQPQPEPVMPPTPNQAPGGTPGTDGTGSAI